MSWVSSLSIKKFAIVAAIVGGAAGLAGCAPYGGAGYGYYGPSAAVYSDYGYGYGGGYYGGGYYGGYAGGYRPRYYGGGHYRPGRPGGWNRPGGGFGGGHISGPGLGMRTGGAAMPSRAAFGGGGRSFGGGGGGRPLGRGLGH
jgi:hypothetical protein